VTLPTATELYATAEATWPAAEVKILGPWLIRNGAEGGKRVLATTVISGFSDEAIADAEMAMIALKQPKLFMIREGDDVLDLALAERGYDVIDPVLLYAGPIAKLTQETAAPVSGFSIWPPLEIMKSIWADGGIGAGRLDVMGRAEISKTGILARASDRAAGCAFVGIYESIAMIHAIEVAPTQRRKGAGINILRYTAKWAQDHGARYFSLAVTDANDAANALYRKLGMSVVGRYHYRIKQK
jgi:ribosomal protein S18 acetylase RimI-like enzyme